MRKGLRRGQEGARALADRLIILVVPQRRSARPAGPAHLIENAINDAPDGSAAEE